MAAKLKGNTYFFITFDFKVLKATVGEVWIMVDGTEYHLRAGEGGHFEVPIHLHSGGDSYVVREGNALPSASNSAPAAPSYNPDFTDGPRPILGSGVTVSAGQESKDA